MFSREPNLYDVKHGAAEVCLATISQKCVPNATESKVNGRRDRCRSRLRLRDSDLLEVPRQSGSGRSAPLTVPRELTAGVSVFLIVSSTKLERPRSHPGVLRRWTVNGSSRFCVTV